jgi:hypothetical protein
LGRDRNLDDTLEEEFHETTTAVWLWLSPTLAPALCFFTLLMYYGLNEVRRGCRPDAERCRRAGP